MRVLHTRVQAEATGRWKTMRTIADQEHPALPERLRHLHADAPDRAVEQGHVEVGNADMAADDFDELLIGPRLLAVVLGLSDLGHRQPAVAAVGVEDGRSWQARLVGEDHEACGFARDRQGRQIGAPILVRHHRQRRRSDHFDAGTAAGTAAGAVGRDQVGRAPLGDFAGLLAARLDPNAAVGFLEQFTLGAEQHGGVLRFLDDAQDFLLDRVLRDQALPCRGMADIRLRAGAAVLVSRDAVEEHEHVGIFLQAAVADRGLDPPLPEDLHGADPAAARLRMIGRGRALLDHHAVDAEAVKQ